MAKESKKPVLTARQKRFCDEWLLCMNGAEAARRAGYSVKCADRIASENLRKPEIAAYIDERKKAEEELLGFSRFTLISDLQEIKERCMQKVPVMTFNREEGVYEQEKAKVRREKKSGEEENKTTEKKEEEQFTEEGVWEFDARGAIAAIGEVNRMMGYHAPEKHDHTTKGEKIDRVVVTIVRPKTDGKGT